MQVTLGLLTYNHEKFVVPALRGVLQQTYHPLQVLITDDASTDRTQQLIRAELERYQGPHKVQFYANARNLGLSLNINQHMEVATGELYVIASGDDISYPNRVERLVEAFLASGSETMSLHSNARIIDENGNVLRLNLQQDPPSWPCRNPGDVRNFHGVRVLGASHAWNRSVFDVFGPLPAGMDIEDWVIPFRSGLIGKIVYVNEVLVDYRLHGSSMSFVDVWSGSRKWYADKLRLVEKLIPALWCIDKDLALAQQVLPERKAVVASLQEINRRALMELMDSRELFQNNVSFPRKVLMAGKYFRGDGGFKKGVVWLLTYFCPSLYLKYIQFRLRGLAKKSVG
jgi:glycosyltransferase involved in cell wall biosynthesis